ncbi:type IV toxin-antitoxin system AbiEi family antitoxin domain-containing protein [Patulibacter sp. NPDC049589]|uniref:type IV toxin-antitoxin system AbiEi family antitoxin domain-containing protein n=1 Tax=Patulibacter sp. NPDC049589 TaxID=3154731 RepID=UPI003441B174
MPLPDRVVPGERGELGPIAPAGRWSDAAVLARRQHGVISRSQLRSLGFSDGQVDRAIAAGRLHPVHRGVFALGHDRLSATGRISAAVLACGAGAAAGYRSAAAIWSVRPSSNPRVEVVIPRRSALSRSGIVVHCHAAVEPDEVTTLDGVPVTTVGRTMLDTAAVLGRDPLRSAIKQAEVLRLFDLFEVRKLLARHPRHRGARALGEVLRSWTDPARTRSDLELEFLAVCARHGLPRPLMNGTFEGLEIDALFPDHGVAVELDGGRFHENPLQRDDDYEKRARLEAAGWRFVAFTSRQVFDRGGAFPAEILRRLLHRYP